MTVRADRVVIMARGASRRMGTAKGLLLCPGDTAETFVTRIAALYAKLGIEGLLVCTPGLAAAYRAELAHSPGIQVVAAESGGETGRTVQLGWQALGADTTHLWAHPSDLPLVTGATLAQLKAVSASKPDRIVRPASGQEPGHPVIVPVTAMEALSGHELWHAAPVRDVIAYGRRYGLLEEPLVVPVTDSGVVDDFDQPGDLDRA